MAEWIPKGDWSDVGLGSAKTVKHTFTKHVGELVKDAPTPEERRVRKMMRDLFLETGGKSDEELAKILAPKLGKTPQEILDINTKVALFDLGR